MARFPDLPGFASIEVGTHQPVRASTTHSQQTTRLSNKSQRWGISVTLPPTKVPGPIKAFIVEQEGRAGTFDIVLPAESYTSGDNKSKTHVDGGHSKGATLIDIRGNEAALLQGDYIKFANHAKVYMLCSGTTKSQLHIMPALRQDVADNELVIFDEVPFQVMLAKDDHKWQAGNGYWYKFESIKMVEDII